VALADIIECAREANVMLKAHVRHHPFELGEAAAEVGPGHNQMWKMRVPS
jgi:hypothetical protein